MYSQNYIENKLYFCGIKAIARDEAFCGRDTTCNFSKQATLIQIPY